MGAFKESGVVIVEDEEYFWEVRHLRGAPTGLMGLSISISLDPGKRRELIVEFRPTEFGTGKPRSQPQFEARLQGCIAAAQLEGWRPNSRGRPWIHVADDPVRSAQP